MRPYQVYINHEALLTAPRSGQQRRAIMDFIASLSNNPFSQGDFTELDDTGRNIFVKVVGNFAITYWADHAVCEIKVTHVRRADR
jgi:hypothetical protein